MRAKDCAYYSAKDKALKKAIKRAETLTDLHIFTPCGLLDRLLNRYFDNVEEWFLRFGRDAAE